MVRQIGGVTLGRLLGFLLQLPSAMIRACGDMNGRSQGTIMAHHGRLNQ